MKLKAKIVSSLEKVFCEADHSEYPVLERISALKGESLAFQLVCHTEKEWDERASYSRQECDLAISGPLAAYASVKEVRNTPVELPINPDVADEGYLRLTPGLYPDPITEVRNQGAVIVKSGLLTSLWIELDIPKELELHGPTQLTLTLIPRAEGDLEATPVSQTLTVEVINAVLPEQSTIYTQWFYCDCIADYYDVPVFSEKHWEYVENFARVAHRNGVNMLLTPILTPPLDTEIGLERTTVQLVGITKTESGYEFDFSLLDRWIDMCDRIGIKYLEINHLYTQWGCKHAPKVMATVDGEYRRIFGWDTDAVGEEYREFLRLLLIELIAHLKARGDDGRCYFHISDEPKLAHLEQYEAVKGQIKDLLEGYPIIDALSNYDFYLQGVVERPIPSSNHIEPFLEGGVKDLWTYYCCTQTKGVSNRFIAMPSARTRSIGFQIYRYDIKGFLHWGYNYYNNLRSKDQIDPFLESAGDYWVGAGDAYSVLPGRGGKPIETLRIRNFLHALQDIEAMKLCESLCGRDETVKALEEAFGGEISFDKCALDSQTMLRIRERINEMIKAKL